MIMNEHKNIIATIAIDDLQRMILNCFANYDEEIAPILEHMNKGDNPESFKQGFLQGMAWTSIIANVKLCKCFIDGDIINK